MKTPWAVKLPGKKELQAKPKKAPTANKSKPKKVTK
jgi:hypothetical protein